MSNCDFHDKSALLQKTKNVPPTFTPVDLKPLSTFIRLWSILHQHKQA